MIGQRAVAAMERGIEASNLRQLRAPLEDGADRCKIVGLVQGRKGNVARKVLQHDFVHPDRRL